MVPLAYHDIPASSVLYHLAHMIPMHPATPSPEGDGIENHRQQGFGEAWLSIFPAELKKY